MKNQIQNYDDKWMAETFMSVWKVLNNKTR